MAVPSSRRIFAQLDTPRSPAHPPLIASCLLRHPSPLATMFNGLVKKVSKPNGAKPSEFEDRVGNELFNLEMSAADIKSELRDL